MENSLPGPIPTQTLFSISADIQQMNALLDELDDTEQQQFITDWLENLEAERDRKLDNYATLIAELEARADVRKAEAKRLMELVAADEKRAKLLKERLKYFFETNQLKKVETNRYRLSLVKHGGKAPVILDESVQATQLPERFRRISIEPDTKAIREALEAGEQLDFAQLGDRGSSIRIT